MYSQALPPVLKDYTEITRQRFTGCAKTTVHDKGVYFGEFQDGVIEGRGRMEFLDGRKYMGEWKNNVFHGDGRLTYSDGTTYCGDWVDGKRHGHGEMQFKNKSSYKGGFKDDKQDGDGRFVYENGTVFTGAFKNGRRDGAGVLVVGDVPGASERGAEYRGTWKKGQKYGNFVKIMPDGKRFGMTYGKGGVMNKRSLVRLHTATPLVAVPTDVAADSENGSARENSPELSTEVGRASSIVNASGVRMTTRLRRRIIESYTAPTDSLGGWQDACR